MSYEFTHGYERSDSDFYVEPRWSVLALARSIKFEGQIYDPACGSGTIPKTFEGLGFTASGSDLKDRGFGLPNINFLRDYAKRENIITNPPYNLAEDFIKHALVVAEKRIAILARIAFLNGQKRFQLYNQHPPECVVILSKRPSMPPGGRMIMPQGGKTDFCWIVWNREPRGETIIRWSL